MNPRKPFIIALSLAAISASIMQFNHIKGDPAPAMNTGNGASHSRKSNREREAGSMDSKEERIREERQKQLTFWSENASAGFARSKKNLVADLNLPAENAAEVDKIFARREAELAGLLAAMHSGEAAYDMETLGKICALLRNKGLREDLAGILSPEKMAAFDANEATRERDTIEARAYRDMAEINEVASLTDSQKEQALAVLIRNASAKVEQEADARAFLTLNYGQMLADVDSSSIRGLSNMVSAGLEYELPAADAGSPQYQQWAQTKKMERIEHELSALQHVLNETQLTRYREHLEAEPAW